MKQPTAARSVYKVMPRAWELRVRVTEEEFDGFYAAVFARLVGQLALVTGDLHEAEEVVQEALARAVPRWARRRLGSAASRSTWPPATTGRRAGGWRRCSAWGHRRRCHRSRRTRSRWPRRCGQCPCPTAR